MMRRVFVVSTLFFWAAAGGFALIALFAPEVPVAATPGQPAYTPAELAKHDRKQDCWMAIRGEVYDLTAYLPQHPSDPALVLPWCGKDATWAYETKTKGRPHSPYADQLLAKYRLGRLAR